MSCTLMLSLLTGVLYAQTVVQTTVKEGPRSHAEEVKAIFKEAYRPQKISWWDSGNGLVCRHTVDNDSYIIRYDKHGNYIETLRPKAWNEESALQPAFQKSEYKLHKVISYWEVSDTNKKGYYLELMNDANQLTSLWADESGKFSTIPATGRSNQ